MLLEPTNFYCWHVFFAAQLSHTIFARLFIDETKQKQHSLSPFPGELPTLLPADHLPLSTNRCVTLFLRITRLITRSSELSSTNSVILIVVIFILMVLFADFAFQWMPMPFLRSSHELPLRFLRSCY